MDHDAVGVVARHTAVYQVPPHDVVQEDLARAISDDVVTREGGA